MLRGDEGELLIDHARFDQGRLRDRVDLEDAPHPSHLQGDSAADGDRSAGQAGAGPARHHGDAVPGCDLHHLRCFLGRRHEHDRVGHRAFDGSVALEDPQVVGRNDHGLPPDGAAQLLGHYLVYGHQAIGASRSGLCSKASKRRVIAPGKLGASLPWAPTIRSSTQRRHSSSEGMRSPRSKIASWIRLWGETWIVYQTDRPSGVTA